MKREKFLWPLTQGHHRGLVAAKNIKNRIAQMKVGTQESEMQTLRTETQEFWESELKAHFAAEEEMLQVFATHVGEDDPDITRTFQEHRTLMQLIQNGSKEELIRFAELLTAHIRYEEEGLFPRLEKGLTPVEIKRQEEVLLQKAVPACVKIPAPSSVPQSSNDKT